MQHKNIQHRYITYVFNKNIIDLSRALFKLYEGLGSRIELIDFKAKTD